MLAKITMNSFMDEFFMWMEERIKRDINNDPSYQSYKMPKMAYFSTHDVTLAGLLTYMQKALDFNEIYYVPFASVLNVELYRTSTTQAKSKSDFSVRINFNDNIYGPYKYETFKSKMYEEYMTLEDIDDYCDGLPSFVSYAFRKATIGLAILTGIFLLAFLATLIICCCCYERKQSHDKVGSTVPHDSKV